MPRYRSCFLALLLFGSIISSPQCGIIFDTSDGGDVHLRWLRFFVAVEAFQVPATSNRLPTAYGQSFFRLDRTQNNSNEDVKGGRKKRCAVGYAILNSGGAGSDGLGSYGPRSLNKQPAGEDQDTTERLNHRMKVRVHAASRRNRRRGKKIMVTPSQAATEAMQTLERMESEYKADPVNCLTGPDTTTYNIVIDAVARSGEEGAVLRAEKLLARMHSLHESGYPHVRPNIVTYGSIINGWAKTRDESAPWQAEKVLRRLEGIYEREGDEALKPNARVFNAVIDAWARQAGASTKGRTAAKHSYGVLKRMEELYVQGVNIDAKPDTFSFTTCINAFARAGGKVGADMAGRLVSMMEAMYADDPAGIVKPNSFTYTALISALGNSGGGESAARRAEEVLMRMSSLYQSGTNSEAKPNVFSYQGVLLAWVKSKGGIRAAKRTENILNHMHTLYESGERDCRPSTNCYNSVLEAWSESGGGVAAAKHSEAILRKMERMASVQSKIGVMPDTRSINYAILAWTESGCEDAGENAERVFETFDRIAKQKNTRRNPRRDTISYNAVISAYAKSPKDSAARKAEAILYRLIELERSVDSSARDTEGQGEVSSRVRVLPNTRSFVPVINCWARCGEQGAAERAQQLLDKMEKLYLGGNHAVKPNTILYTSVISAWAKESRNDAASKAQGIFDRMKVLANSTGDLDFSPNTVTYNALLQCWAMTRGDDSTTRALSLLAEMEELERQGRHDVSLTVRSYSTVMRCLSTSAGNTTESAEAAEKLLAQMLERYQEGAIDLRPDTGCYNAVIVALARSRAKGSAEKAQLIFEKMKATNSASSAPDTVTYVGLINAWVSSAGQDGVDQAVRLFDELKENMEAGDDNLKPSKMALNRALNAFSWDGRHEKADDMIKQLSALNASR